ncbi:gastric triacylglycerol lipase-like [Adelges cooleyi]|uniref:gastric triacylglycerol lipase-like n=1 Tax=Adelges cooleyi TaxID=133065 RepID=UPI00217F88F1|nr:gastric triacylglycerol lipase-like [Adelges cooleyi]
MNINRIKCLISFLTIMAVTRLHSALQTGDKILEYGYPLEIHEFQSEDGYMLGFERIPHSKYNTTVGKPVLMVHGLYGSSMFFSVLNTSLAFAVSDAGFDVWLLNFRLSGISKNIKDPKTGIIPPLQNTSWDFSFDEFAIYDLTAAIDYVLNITEHDKVDLTGYSLGGTIALIALSERPEYQSKVNKLVMVGPTSRMKYYNAPATRNFPLLMRFMKGRVYVPHIKDYDNQQLGYYCLKETLFAKLLCTYIVNVVQGRIVSHNTKALEILKIYPQPTSVKVITHYFQLIRSDRFCKFNYGKLGNLKYYNSTKPPEYDLSKINVAVYILHAKVDLIAPPKDIRWLIKSLPNVKKTKCVQEVNFSHLSFVISPIAKYFVNSFVVDSLQEEI